MTCGWGFSSPQFCCRQVRPVRSSVWMTPHHPRQGDRTDSNQDILLGIGDEACPGP